MFAAITNNTAQTKHLVIFDKCGIFRGYSYFLSILVKSCLQLWLSNKNKSLDHERIFIGNVGDGPCLGFGYKSLISDPITSLSQFRF